MLVACINIGINEVTLVVADVDYRVKAEVLAISSHPIWRSSKLNSPSLCEISRAIKATVDSGQFFSGYTIRRVFVSVSSIYAKSRSLAVSVPIRAEHLQYPDLEYLIAGVKKDKRLKPMWSVQQVLAQSLQIDGQEKSDCVINRCAHHSLTIYSHLIGGPPGLLADACTACHMCGLKVYDTITNHAAIQVYADMHSDHFGNTLAVDIGEYFTSLIFYDNAVVSYSKIFACGVERFFNIFCRLLSGNKATADKALATIALGLIKVSNFKKFTPTLRLFYFFRKRKIQKFFVIELYNFFYEAFWQIPIRDLPNPKLDKIILIGEFFQFPGVEFIAEEAFRELNKVFKKKFRLEFATPYWPMVGLSAFNQFTAVFGNLMHTIKHPKVYCNFYFKIIYTLQLWIDDLI